MGKATKAIALCTIFIVSVVASSIFLSGMLQNSSSSSNGNGSSQNSDLATYTGYLVSGLDFIPLIGSDSVPQGWSGASVSMTFADGRTFIAHEDLAVNRNVVLNATYTVYYNNSQPSVAIDIIKQSASNSNWNSITPSPSPTPSSQPSDIGFMNNAEQVTASNPVFNAGATAVTLTVRNTGASSIAISAVGTIDGQAAVASATGSLTIAKSQTEDITLSLGSGTFTPGAQYQLGLVTAKGTTIVYTATYNP